MGIWEGYLQFCGGMRWKFIGFLLKLFILILGKYFICLFVYRREMINKLGMDDDYYNYKYMWQDGEDLYVILSLFFLINLMLGQKVRMDLFDIYLYLIIFFRIIGVFKVCFNSGNGLFFF